VSSFRPEDVVGGILSAIVESSGDAIIGKDLDGVVLTWNRGAEHLYGYAAQEIVGRSISLLIPEDQQDELPAVLARVRAGERVDPYETVRRTKDGHRIDVSLTVSPIKDATGRVVGASAVARDITPRKHADAALRASEARWRSIVDSAVDGIVVIDIRGRIEAFNPAAERLFGYGEREILGRNVNETGVQKIIGIGREVTGLRSDWTAFPMHLSVGEVAVEGGRKFTGIIHDLSARVDIEEQLREQTALARLGEMAAVIAHEVKNPLAGVRGAIQVIGTRLAKDSKDAGMITEIVARIDALNELMQDLLLFARPPHPKPVAVDVRALVVTTADLLSGDPALRDVQVHIDGSAEPIEADAGLLKIVFENILANGAQAMQGRGRIRVSLGTNDGICQITFSDSGPGIPAELREKIFTPFFTTKARGSGLGLPTAKRLVEAHHGHITIACPPGGGTTVTIDLPARGPTIP
jgi:PAS domain S-box-containing protein